MVVLLVGLVTDKLNLLVVLVLDGDLGLMTPVCEFAYNSCRCGTRVL